MNEKYFLTIKRNEGNRLITEEIPLSTEEAEQFKRLHKEEQMAYNAAESRNNTPVAHGGKHERRGPASEGQRRFISDLQRNSTQRYKIEQYIIEHGIDMATLTNAQANEIIQAGKDRCP